MNEKKWLYALSRHEYDFSKVCIDSYAGSHDAYIFNSSFIDEKIINNNYTDFKQNCPGIESRIISGFYNSKFEIFNPCYQIVIVHLHRSNIRNWGNWVGLYVSGDFKTFLNSSSNVPPKNINTDDIY